MRSDETLILLNRDQQRLAHALDRNKKLTKEQIETRAGGYPFTSPVRSTSSTTRRKRARIRRRPSPGEPVVNRADRIRPRFGDRGASVADNMTAAQRSATMSRIRSRDTRAELVVRRLLHARGLRYRTHVPGLDWRAAVVGARRYGRWETRSAARRRATMC
jgi:hypothetical protein